MPRAWNKKQKKNNKIDTIKVQESIIRLFLF